METKYDVKRSTKFATNQDANMALMKENKQLKSMLLLHLNVIQEQNDMIVAKDKQIASLQAKLDRMEAKYPAQSSTPGQDENTQPPLSGVVPTGMVGTPVGNNQGHVRPVVQHLSRGAIMKMAALNQTSGGQLRIRPLMISLKKVLPAGVDQKAGITSFKPQNTQKTIQLENSNLSSQPWIRDETKTIPVVTVDQSAVKGSFPLVQNKLSGPKIEKPVPVVEQCPNGNDVGPGSGDKMTPSDEEEIVLMDTDEPPEIIVSDGSPIEIPIELKLEDDDDVLSLSGSPTKQQQTQSATAIAPVEANQKQSTVKLKLSPVKSESLDQPQAAKVLLTSESKAMRLEKTASPVECSDRAPRKYSRVMSTRKLYVTRHWEEEEDPEEANSLVVPELKEGESNLEVPHWKEVDAQGLEEEIAAEDAGNALAEDLSAAAFLKRHAKHEADERRRKRWDIQRFREQRTIEKLKKRQCKSDIFYSASGLQCGPEEQQSQSTEPMSLYPSLSSIRHVETTEYLPVQAFGEPIPTPPSAEFHLPWMDGGGGESIEMAQHEAGPGKEALVGALGVPGQPPQGENANKYSSFYVKQNNSSSSVPMRLAGSAKFRFKRVKSQGSSSGRR